MADVPPSVGIRPNVARVHPGTYGRGSNGGGTPSCARRVSRAVNEPNASSSRRVEASNAGSGVTVVPRNPPPASGQAVVRSTSSRRRLRAKPKNCRSTTSRPGRAVGSRPGRPRRRCMSTSRCAALVGQEPGERGQGVLDGVLGATDGARAQDLRLAAGRAGRLRGRFRMRRQQQQCGGRARRPVRRSRRSPAL